MFEIGGVILDHGTGAFEIRRESGRCNFFSDFPCVKGLVGLETLGGWGTTTGDGSLIPNLSIKDFLTVIGLFVVWLDSWLSSGACAGE